jgi:hypothetical protein
MDNILKMQAGLQRERKRSGNRLVPYIDTRDIAEAAGRVLLSDNHGTWPVPHVEQRPGHDALQRRRRVDDAGVRREDRYGSRSAFCRIPESWGPILPKLWEFFEFEQDNEEVWALNNFVERTIGRKPITLREWLMENKRELLGLDQPNQAAARG